MSTKKTSPEVTAAASKYPTKTTASRAAHPDVTGSGPLARHAQDVQQLVSAVPCNTNKPSEFGRENSPAPATGYSVKAPSVGTTASTQTEGNRSAKIGGGPAPGLNANSGTLERVRSDASGQRMTTNQGVAISDNQNSLKAGLRGPTLLEDHILREKITHFDHERIPERIVHARGSGAHGYFECYEALTDLTRAAPFQQEGKITPVFVRFSTVVGERGSIDTARDARGFAVKFYTDEGNWDIVGINMPVFFIQDAMKFPDLVHALKTEPHDGMPQAASAHDTFWDFASLMPELTHMLMWVMSDRAIPRSYRTMQGFGVHTYRLVNAAGQSKFVKFHWKPKLGTHSLVWDEAVKIGGADSDFHRRDLWDAIECGNYPEWELGLQVFTEQESVNWSFDILDPTKLVPEELVPVQLVGRLVLNRNPDNFFAETEQAAFCTANVVPGIDFSNDPLLAGRIHSYFDTQISRLGGANFHEIPINAPIAPVHNNQRDGMHRQAVDRGRVSYEPNSLGGGCPFQAGGDGFVSFPQPVEGDTVRGKPEKFAEHYQQATLFWNSQTDWEKSHVVGGFRFELSKCTVPAIRERMVAGLVNVAPDLASRVAAGLGMEVPPALPMVLAQALAPEVTVSPALSLTALPGDGGASALKVAILVADGISGASVLALHKMLIQTGAVPSIVAPRLGTVTTTDSTRLEATATLENSPSVLFDALVLPDGQAGVDMLTAVGQTGEFVVNQYRHCKTILALGASKQLLDQLGVAAILPSGEVDDGVLIGTSEDVKSLSKLFIRAIGKHRHTARDRDPPLV